MPWRNCGNAVTINSIACEICVEGMNITIFENLCQRFWNGIRMMHWMWHATHVKLGCW